MLEWSFSLLWNVECSQAKAILQINLIICVYCIIDSSTREESHTLYTTRKINITTFRTKRKTHSTGARTETKHWVVHKDIDNSRCVTGYIIIITCSNICHKNTHTHINLNIQVLSITETHTVYGMCMCGYVCAYVYLKAWIVTLTVYTPSTCINVYLTN